MPNRKINRDIFRRAINAPGLVYYVDFTGGNDANSGLIPGLAWKTEAAVNGAALEPGDRVLFKRGEIWPLAAIVNVPADGLYFGTYGAGANPILDGQDTVDCIHSNGHDNLWFENIEVTQGLDFGFAFDNVHDIYLTNCSAHDCGNDNLIFSNAYNCRVDGGTYYNAYTRLLDGRVISAIEIKDGSHDIVIDSSEIYGCAGVAAPVHYGAGIAIHSHLGFIMPFNIEVKNCNIHNQGMNCFGMRIANLNNAVMTARNIRIHHNIMEDGAYGGIQVNGQAGVAFRLTGVDIYNNRILTNAGQWGVGLVNLDDCRVYRNVITNNNNSQTQQCLTAVNCTNILIANNTTYNLFDNFWFPVYFEGATTANLVFENNIVGGAIPGMMGISVAALTGVVGMVIDYNLYQYAAGGNRFSWLGVAMSYANWLTNNSNDANSPARGNPLFTNPAGEDFTLQALSPAIDAGVVIPGVTDDYLGAAPDCGYIETA